jgi:hypothetical protein
MTKSDWNKFAEAESEIVARMTRQIDAHPWSDKDRPDPRALAREIAVFRVSAFAELAATE